MLLIYSIAETCQRILTVELIDLKEGKVKVEDKGLDEIKSNIKKMRIVRLFLKWEVVKMRLLRKWEVVKMR